MDRIARVATEEKKLTERPLDDIFFDPFAASIFLHPRG
jgi:hypothetical protein